MFSRLVLLSSAAVLVLAGCSLRHSPPQSAPFAIHPEQLGCLDKAGNQVESYFEGSASASDVDAIWNCAEGALDQFVSKVVGAQPGVYSAQELSDFLARYFIHNVPLTPDLVAQVGRLKQVLVGGRADQLSVDELHRLKRLFEVFRAQTQALRSFMPIAPPGSGPWTGIGGLRWQDIRREDLDRFTGLLKSAATAVGDQLDATATPYTFTELDRLAQAFLNALPDNGDYPGTISALKAIHEHLDLARAAKNTLLVPEKAADADVLSSGRDWTELLQGAADWVGFFVRLKWFSDAGRMSVSQESLDQGAGLVSLGRIFDQFHGMLLRTTKLHPEQTITFDELDRLAQALPAASLPVPARDIESSLRPIVRRLIGGADPGPDGRGAAGVTPGILAKLYGAFHNWYEGERFLETLFQTLEQQEGDPVGADYLWATLVTSPKASKLWNQVEQQQAQQPAQPGQPTGPQWNSYTRLAAERLRKIIGAQGPVLRPLFAGNDNEITFPKYDEGLRYSFHDLATINWMQNLSRLLVLGYAGGDVESGSGIPVRADVDHWQPGSGSVTGAGVTLDEFTQAFNDVKPIGLDLKYFDPTNPNSARSRFREGDVFTYVSDGNGYLDMNEAATLLAFAVSAKRKADRIHQDIARRCHSGVLDAIWQQPLIDYSCYMSWFYGQVQDYWDKLDEMIPYYENLDDAAKSRFQVLLETSGRTGGYKPGVALTINDTESIVGALQYIEAIFTRYDVNDRGYLTPSEAANAFPVFKGLLEQMGKNLNPPVNLDDSSANLVFTYMLAKGRIPHGSWAVIWWDIVKNLPLLGNFKADRFRVLQIFAALAAAQAPSAPPAKPVASP